MSRWFSKKHKSKYSFELKRYGCIANKTRYVLAARKPTNELEPWSEEDYPVGGAPCTFCLKKSTDLYDLIEGFEYPEVVYSTCKKCAAKILYRELIGLDRSLSGYTNLARWKRKNQLKPNKFYCDNFDTLNNEPCVCCKNTTK